MSRSLVLVLLLFTISGTTDAQPGPLSDSIVFYFRFDACRLSSAESGRLQEWLTGHNNSSTFIVSGFTDTVGSVAYNVHLSRCRAKTIAQYLEAVLKNREVKIAAYGESFPASKTVHRLNRRVVIMTEVTKAVTETKDSVITQNPVIRDSGLTKMDTVVHIKQKLQAENIFFFPNKASILPESQSYLEELAQTLLKFPTDVNFEIRGYVNCPECKSKLDTANDLYQLSKDRAKEVYLHLVSMGVPATRMRHVGMGWLNMVYPIPKSETEMRKNMRVEVAVY